MTDAATPTRRFPLFLTVFFAVLLAIVLAAVVIRVWIFPSAFTPVTLNNSEQRELTQKLSILGIQLDDSQPTANGQAKRLEPEAYQESDAKRTVHFSEKELNAIIAKQNSDLASRFAIDLSDNLASAKILIPLDPDFPIMGGETIRINAGVEIAFANQRPTVRLRGVSLWGVPLPNAWLGNLKNKDLIEEYGQSPGFWQSFSQGVAFIQVEDGQLVVKLQE